VVFDPDGDTVLQMVDVGATVQSLLWDSTWNRLYVGTGLDSGWLEVYDCAADTLVAEIQLGFRDVSHPGLSHASRKLYCAGYPDTAVFVGSTESLTTTGVVRGLTRLDAMLYCPATDRMFCPEIYYGLSVFDCQADSVRTRIEMQGLFSLTVSTLSGKAYLGREDSAQVMVVDTTDSIVGSIPLPAVPSHEVIALTFGPDRNQVYGVTAPGGLAFSIDASADTVAGVLSYAVYTPCKMVHNPAGNKLYLLCPGADEVLVVDSTFGAPEHVLDGATGTYGVPTLNQALNRLLVADDRELRIIDCNSDSLIRIHSLNSIRRPRPVLVPYLNKLYVFDSHGNGDYVFAYDCPRDTAIQLFELGDDVPSAVYDPRSNRVFFACEDAPSVRALDPVTDSVVKTWDLAGTSTRGRFALNIDLGRLYYTNQSSDQMFTIDVQTDSLLGVTELPWDIDTLFLDQRLSKLYLCSRDTAAVLVFDCHQGAITDTIDADFHYSALMDDRTDKLYLRYGAVVDCRYDSVVTVLPPDSLSPRSMAWDAIDNRVFQATASRLYVCRDDLYGVEQRPAGNTGPMLAVLGNPVRNGVWLRLQIPQGQTGRLAVYDAAGRLVHSSFVISTSSFRLDLRSVSAGVYFVCLEAGRTRATEKVIVQR